MQILHVERFIHQVWQHAENDISFQLYAILDAARSDTIYNTLAKTDNPCTSLFIGEKAHEMATVAPYLVMLKRDDSLTNWFLTNGWGKSWGILVGSTATFNEIKRHLQSFLMVYDEDGKPLYFRYYDPRVLRVYLPTCNESELHTVFGPIDFYGVEDEKSDSLIEYVFTSGQLIQRTIEI